MPALIEETVNYPSAWLKWEESIAYSREEVTLLTGTAYKSGMVLGKITASGKYTLNTVAAEDGSQNAAAILVYDVDATGGDKPGVVIARAAIVMHQGLKHGADVNTAPERAAVNAALAAKGIIVREGA